MFIFSERRRRRRQAAEALYACAAAAARHPALYGEYAVPDTFEGRFEMVILHLFPLVHRLMPADADPDLARLVSEAFVADSDAALREMGVGDLTVPKRMKKLYASFAGRISAYSAAYAAGGPALREAVARNVYPADAEEPCVSAMTQYLQSLVEALAAADLAALGEGRVAYPAPVAEERNAS